MVAGFELGTTGTQSEHLSEFPLFHVEVDFIPVCLVLHKYQRQEESPLFNASCQEGQVDSRMDRDPFQQTITYIFACFNKYTLHLLCLMYFNI